MSWQEAVAFGVVLMALAVGVGAAGFLYARRPSFWLGFLLLALKKLVPVGTLVWKFISRRKTPEQEARDREDFRQGVTRDLLGNIRNK